MSSDPRKDRFGNLVFESGPGTVVDPQYIKYLDRVESAGDSVKVVQIDRERRLFLQGNFKDFRLYFLVTHTRVEVKPESVELISQEHFRATVKLELSLGNVTEHKVVFRNPLFPHHVRSIRASSRGGLLPDSFEFRGSGPGAEIFQCDLSFLLHCAENPPEIPLNVAYVGIAKAENRLAQDRLGEGHEKLQDLLADLNARQGRTTASIVLYKPGKPEDMNLAFSDLLEIIEGFYITYFKPDRNVRKKEFPNDSPDLVRKLLATNALTYQVSLMAPRSTALESAVAPRQNPHWIMGRLG